MDACPPRRRPFRQEGGWARDHTLRRAPRPGSQARHRQALGHGPANRPGPPAEQRPELRRPRAPERRRPPGRGRSAVRQRPSPARILGHCRVGSARPDSAGSCARAARIPARLRSSRSARGKFRARRHPPRVRPPPRAARNLLGVVYPDAERYRALAEAVGTPALLGAGSSCTACVYQFRHVSIWINLGVDSDQISRYYPSGIGQPPNQQRTGTLWGRRPMPCGRRS